GLVMTHPFAYCPSPPSWQVDWTFLDREYDWIRNLKGCEQHPTNHGEGDVWTHTRMVCEALASLPAWRALDETPRHVGFTAGLWHDVAKPICRRVDLDGYASFRGHSRRGAILARAILWRLELPFAQREQVVALVRHHLAPFHLVDRPD